MNSRRSTTTLIAATSLVALLAGCSGNDQPEPVSTPVTSTTSRSDDSQATTSQPHESSSTAAPDAGSATSGEDVGATDGSSGAALPTVPGEYADALVRAWGSGDHMTVERMATAAVVHTLGDQGGPHWEQTSAEGAAGSTIVTYTNTESGDTLELRVQNETAGQGGEHAVKEARYTAAGDQQDAVPTVPTDYADALVVAWGTDDHASMERLATAEVIDILNGHGSPHWDRISAEGAAGSTIVTYEETQTHEVLTLRVENALVSQGAEQAVVEARFEAS